LPGKFCHFGAALGGVLQGNKSKASFDISKGQGCCGTAVGGSGRSVDSRQWVGASRADPRLRVTRYRFPRSDHRWINERHSEILAESHFKKLAHFFNGRKRGARFPN
jgi:hypothetical protein